LTPPYWRKIYAHASTKKEVGTDHEEASEPHNIFGVPTILRDGQEPTFVKLAAGTWEGSEDLEFFYDLFKVSTRPYVLEIKKPASSARR
jgi:hypothetical protein